MLKLKTGSNTWSDTPTRPQSLTRWPVDPVPPLIHSIAVCVWCR